MSRIYRKPKLWRSQAIGGAVIGDPPMVFDRQKHRNKAQENARKRKSQYTPAEREFERILNSLNGGVLRNRFFREWAFADRWILDFFFHEIRLGIEVDGNIHDSPSQAQKDRDKEKACDEWDITLIRIKNEEVFSNRDVLVEKLRDGWRKAQRHFRQSVYA